MKKFKNDENLSIIKNKEPNKGGEKGTTWKDPNLGKLRIFQKGHIIRGTRRNQVLEPCPRVAKHILDKEKGGTPKKVPSLNNPSPIITTHLKIKVVYIHYNAIDTLYM